MRIFAVPAALLLACCVYLPLPRAREGLDAALRHLFRGFLRAFTRKNGQTDEIPALAACLLVLGGVLVPLAALHPLAAALLMAPAFTGLAALPPCARVKDELDAGKYARDIPAYEARVRETCRSLAPAFVDGIAAPMLLCAAGMPLHLGPALGLAYTALCALAPQLPAAARIASAIRRLAERVFCAFMLLCSGTVGRNPLRTRGHGAQGRLLSILGIAGDGADTHAPMAGDIPQGIFLCSFASFILCFTLCAMGFVLCR
ncbi:MAG: hypothetical protein ACI4MP_13780 [Candidatus Ventricola sp.]